MLLEKNDSKDEMFGDKLSRNEGSRAGEEVFEKLCGTVYPSII